MNIKSSATDPHSDGVIASGKMSCAYILVSICGYRRKSVAGLFAFLQLKFSQKSLLKKAWSITEVFFQKTEVVEKKQDVFVLNMRKISLYNLIFKSSLAMGFIMVIWEHRLTESYKTCPEGDFLRHLVGWFCLWTVTTTTNVPQDCLKIRLISVQFSFQHILLL